ncbi:hypothetical protein ACTXT7_012358 [Hymenolepis weldensis]
MTSKECERDSPPSEDEQQNKPNNAGREKNTNPFLKNIRMMLYGFGDVENPLPETAALVEEIAIKFIIEMTTRCMEIGKIGKITVEDIAFLLRRDDRKLSRLNELLIVNRVLSKAKNLVQGLNIYFRMADSELAPDDLFSIEDEPESGGGGANEKKKHLFLKDIRTMLYGFGDVENPLPETVALVEELATQYICDMTRRCMEIGKIGKITVEDIAYLVRKDDRKFSRAKELLLLSEELTRAKKAFEGVKIKDAT